MLYLSAAVLDAQRMMWTPPTQTAAVVPDWRCNSYQSTRGGVKMKITTIGIDLAKSVFSIHGVDQHGKCVLKRQVRREQLLEMMARLEPCLIGMEACSGAHHFARELRKLGHDTRIMAPQFVQPYRKSQKNDGNDAEAICEAVARPNMRFVAIKSEEQEAMLVVHRVRKALVDERTGLINSATRHVMRVWRGAAPSALSAARSSAAGAAR